MAARKMIPPGGLIPPKNPPPPEALRDLTTSHEAYETSWNTEIVKDGLILRFSRELQLVLMTARGARLMANDLLARAGELDEALRREAK